MQKVFKYMDCRFGCKTTVRSVGILGMDQQLVRIFVGRSGLRGHLVRLLVGQVRG